MYQHFLNLLFPKLCFGCDALLLHQEQYLCTHCFYSLNRIPKSKGSFPELIRRFYGKVHFKHALALLYYEDDSISKHLIHQLKYKNQQEIGTYLAEMVHEQFHEHPLFKEIDELVPIPLHQKKEKERGYNQLDSFGRKISELFEIPYNPKRLQRNYYNKSQTKKSIFNRSLIQPELFTAVHLPSDTAKHFLLFDDVVTTGSTIEKAGNALLKIENAHLSLFTITYAR